MLYYLYDGSLEGLFTAVLSAFTRGEVPDAIIIPSEYQPDLFSTEVTIVTDPDAAQKLLSRLVGWVGREVIQELFYCYLSETPGRERLMFDYIRLAQEMGRKVVNHFTDPAVLRIRQLSEGVTREAQRMMGILRFRRLTGGLFYGPMAPDHNILQLLAPHFTARFPAQSWVIHDCRRGLAVYYDQQRWQLVSVTGPVAPELIASAGRVGEEPRAHASHLAPDEVRYEKLWNEYFQKIAIQERTNPRLQRQHLPERYWKYLVEEPGTH